MILQVIPCFPAGVSSFMAQQSLAFTTRCLRQLFRLWVHTHLWCRHQRVACPWYGTSGCSLTQWLTLKNFWGIPDLLEKIHRTWKCLQKEKEKDFQTTSLGVREFVLSLKLTAKSTWKLMGLEGDSFPFGGQKKVYFQERLPVCFQGEKGIRTVRRWKMLQWNDSWWIFWVEIGCSRCFPVTQAWWF